MKFLRILHTAYGFGVFAILFLLLLPFLFIPILFPSQFRLVGILNRIWAKLLFVFCFLPYRIECRSRLNADQQYIFCPNHFSYLDIPTMGLNPVNTIFVGKSEMEKIPLFGYMYGRLHITVNRASLKSKFKTVKNSIEALEAGKSLVIFPEGGIMTHHPPQTSRFKDGAFRVAIEKQIPVVPVTIPHNWIILPDSGEMILHRGTIRIIFHEPIDTRGMGPDDIGPLKETVQNIIDTELKKHGNR